MEPPTAAQPIYAGEYRHTMDAKNRVTIPARWRRGEIEEFFSIADPDGGFLMVMPLDALREVAERVERDARVTPQERQKFIRRFYSRAQHLVVDKAGRMVIPEGQCNQLQLSGEVVLVGSYARFEVWNPEKWEKTCEEDDRTYRQVLAMTGI
ncbi:MAG: hypothetical protein JO069_20340 [Verrucomicrobia bacterium]|nr:hypothetical protein [Verrucomicrobiota bacterium]